ncbi:hypothetical protein BB560_004584 [Smittium megazygosporum]|uniref:TPX2 C-terminal domain-containing protein n=1 Tax=Smittium megazygosporum TaxID=133381 RepID=A0A2T9Z8Z9_9FUNG|nr:hypothetical protein BB560_004584 [Smittium megazygosporum]
MQTPKKYSSISSDASFVFTEGSDSDVNSDSFWEFDVPKNFDFDNTPGPSVDKWFEKRKDTPWAKKTKKLAETKELDPESEQSETQEDSESETRRQSSQDLSNSLKKDYALTPYPKRRAAKSDYSLESIKIAGSAKQNIKIIPAKESVWIVKATPKKQNSSMLKSPISNNFNEPSLIDSEDENGVLSYEDQYNNGSNIVIPNELDSPLSNPATNTQLPKSEAKTALKSAFKSKNIKTTSKKKVGFTSIKFSPIPVASNGNYHENSNESKSNSLNHFPATDEDAFSLTSTASTLSYASSDNYTRIGSTVFDLGKSSDSNSQHDQPRSTINTFMSKLESSNDHNNILESKNSTSARKKRKHEAEQDDTLFIENSPCSVPNDPQGDKRPKKFKLTKPLDVHFTTDTRVRKTTNAQNGKDSKSAKIGVKSSNISHETQHRPTKAQNSELLNNNSAGAVSKPVHSTTFARKVAEIGTKWAAKNTQRKRTGLTVPQPVKFHTDVYAERKLSRLRSAIEKMEKFEREKRNFKAQPIPDFTQPGPSHKPETHEPRQIPIEPFNLQTDIRGEKYREKLEAKLAELEQARVERAQFKARPIPLTTDYPFIPEISHKPPTMIENVVLNTEIRHETRKAWEEGHNERQATKQRLLQKIEQEAYEREQEELVELRKRLVHKPLPIPEYEPFQFQYGEKFLTVPKSPHWSVKPKKYTS